jgi:cation transport ATPase
MIAATVIAGIGSLLGDPGTCAGALVVLVAASPCALAISVPVTVVPRSAPWAGSGADQGRRRLGDAR